MPFRPIDEGQRFLCNFQDEMNKMVERVWHGGVSTRPFDGQPWAPAMDMLEFDDHYVLHAELPGVEADKVDVTCLGNTLTIRGEKLAPTGTGALVNEIRGERRYGVFSRTIQIPEKIDSDRLSAKYCNGVLEIVIPKSDSQKSKSVKVTVRGE